MKFSTQWLGRYVDLSGVDIDEFSERITLSVAELEGVQHFGEGMDSIVVARIERWEKHPDADRLSVCVVDDGSGSPRTVVCGAPNAREGLVTALATPGTQVGEIKVQAASIRGVESAGMLCSAKELGLTEDHSGICDLPEDWAPGTPLHTLIPLIDAVLEIDNKSLTHRPDLWGHVGMAREIAGLLKRPLTMPETDIALGSGEPVDITINHPELCPRYCALRMGGVQVQPSPLWMQTLLHRCDIRTINNVVDVTNFVMFELGNPIHAFDLRQISGSKIDVRLAKEGEQVVTLDDQERKLTAKDLLICDAERPVAIAGVMGLANSEVADDTTELLLESANFRGDGVRRSAMGLGLRTDSSSRFEKALDPALPPVAALRFATLLHEILPTATVTSALGDACSSKGQTPTIETTASYINRRLGTELSSDEVRAYLESVAFEITDLDGDKMAVKVPSYRATKDISIPEDLVEEVGRLHGYDNITPVQPNVEIPKPYRHPDRTLHRRVRTILSLGLDCTEVRSYSFDFEPFLEQIGRGPYERIGIKNPISVDQTHLRPRLLPGLLHALERSIPHSRKLKLYEIGRVFHPDGGKNELPPQPFHLTSLVWKRSGEDAEKADDKAQARDAYSELKGTVEALFEGLGLGIRFQRADEGLPVWLHPVRSASVLADDGTEFGHIGSLHPDVVDALDCGSYVAALELNLDLVRDCGFSEKRYTVVARYPTVPFDLSIIVPESVSHAELHQRILGAHPEWIRSADCTAVYRGDPIPEGEKSMTYRIVFQSDEATLEMEEVNEVVNGLVTRLGDELGGWLRT